MTIEITHRKTKVRIQDDGRASQSHICSLKYSDHAEVIKSFISSVISDIDKSLT